MTTQEKLEDLKYKVLLLEAELDTLIGMLVAQKVINDAEFQIGCDEMEQYIKKEEG